MSKENIKAKTLRKMTSSEKFIEMNAKQKFKNEEMETNYIKKSCNFKKFNLRPPICKSPPNFMFQTHQTKCNLKPIIYPVFNIDKDFGVKDYNNKLKQQQEGIDVKMIQHCSKDNADKTKGSKAREPYIKWPLCYVECPDTKTEKKKARKELEEYLGISKPFQNVVTEKKNEDNEKSEIRTEYAEEWKEFIENWNKTPSLASSKEEITCEEILKKLENEKNIDENKNEWEKKNFIASKEDKEKFFVTNESYKVAQTTSCLHEDKMKNKELNNADSGGCFETKLIAIVCYTLHKFKNLDFSNLSRLIANSLDDIIDREICREKTLGDLVYEKIGYGIEDNEIRYAVSLVSRAMRKCQIVCNTNSDENFEFLTLPSTKKLKIPPIENCKLVKEKIDLGERNVYSDKLIGFYRKMIEKEMLKTTGKTYKGMNLMCSEHFDDLDIKINMVVEASKELYNQRRPNENLTSRPCHKNASEWLCQLVNRKNLNEESNVWQCSHFKGKRVPLLPEKPEVVHVDSEKTLRRKEFCSELRKRRKEAKIKFREQNIAENNSCLVQMLKIDKLKRREQEQSPDALKPSEPDASPVDEFLELQKKLRELKRQEKLLKKAKNVQSGGAGDKNMFGKTKIQCFDLSLPDYLNINDGNHMKIKDKEIEEGIKKHNLPLIREIQKKEKLFHLWDGRENELKVLLNPILDQLQLNQIQNIDTSSRFKNFSFNLDNCIDFYHMLLSNQELTNQKLDEFVLTTKINDLDPLFEEIVQSYPNNPSMMEWCASIPESGFRKIAAHNIDIFDEEKNMVILWSDYFQSSFNLLDDLGINHNYLKNMETSDTYAEQNEPIGPINMAKIKKIWQDLKSPEDLCEYLDNSNAEPLPNVEKLIPEGSEKYKGYFSKSIKRMVKEIFKLDFNSELEKVKAGLEILLEDVSSSSFLDVIVEQEEIPPSINEEKPKVELKEKISSTITRYVDKIINEGIQIVYGKNPAKPKMKKTVFIDDVEIDLDKKISHHHKFYKKYKVKTRSDFNLAYKQTEEGFNNFTTRSLPTIVLPLIAPRSEQFFAINKQKEEASGKFRKKTKKQSGINHIIEEQSYSQLDYSLDKTESSVDIKNSLKVQEIEFLLTLQEELLNNKMNDPNKIIDN